MSIDLNSTKHTTATNLKFETKAVRKKKAKACASVGSKRPPSVGPKKSSEFFDIQNNPAKLTKENLEKASRSKYAQVEEKTSDRTDATESATKSSGAASVTSINSALESVSSNVTAFGSFLAKRSSQMLGLAGAGCFLGLGSLIKLVVISVASIPEGVGIGFVMATKDGIEAQKVDFSSKAANKCAFWPNRVAEMILESVDVNLDNSPTARKVQKFSDEVVAVFHGVFASVPMVVGGGVGLLCNGATAIDDNYLRPLSHKQQNLKDRGQPYR